MYYVSKNKLLFNLKKEEQMSHHQPYIHVTVSYEQEDTTKCATWDCPVDTPEKIAQHVVAKLPDTIQSHHVAHMPDFWREYINTPVADTKITPVITNDHKDLVFILEVIFAIKHAVATTYAQ